MRMFKGLKPGSGSAAEPALGPSEAHERGIRANLKGITAADHCTATAEK